MTKRLKFMFAWASIPAMPTSRSEARLFSPTEQAKPLRTLVFAKGDKADAAKEAGADFVGAEELVAKIQNENWLDFDVVIATPDMMGVVGRLGKVLGPRGLMPTPKAGTVTPDVAKAVTEAKAGKIEYRLDKTNIIHCPIGKVSFGAEKLKENLDALMAAIVKAKPACDQGSVYQVLRNSYNNGPRNKAQCCKVRRIRLLKALMCGSGSSGLLPRLILRQCRRLLWGAALAELYLLQFIP